MLRFFLLLFVVIVSSCGASRKSPDLIYKARTGTNSPYDDHKENKKELKKHNKQAEARQKEIDLINNKNIEKHEKPLKAKKKKS